MNYSLKKLYFTDTTLSKRARSQDFSIQLFGSLNLRGYIPKISNVGFMKHSFSTSKTISIASLTFLTLTNLAFSQESMFQLAPRHLSFSPVLLASFSTFSHWLVAITDSGRILQLEDGSKWDIHYSDRYILNHWKPDDSILISPNYDWFSYGDYYVINNTNNTRVRASLYLDPKSVRFTDRSHWIVSIDHVSGHLTLENGLIWCIHREDSPALMEWELNDHIIIGFYDSWFCSCDHILINSNMNSHVRASQY